MKSLFDEKGNYTNDAKALNEEVRAALRPILEKYMKEGYPKHEVSYLAQTTAHVECIYLQKFTFTD